VELALVFLCCLGLMAVVLPASARELEFGQQAIARAKLEVVARSVRSLVKTARPRVVAGGYGPLAGPRDAKLPSQVDEFQPLEWLFEAKPPEVWKSCLLGTWKGPYLKSLDVDPWGRAWLVLPFGDPGTFCWCLSAGKNGVIETGPADDCVQGDDVGVRVF
jgi:hypothetical protein